MQCSFKLSYFINYIFNVIPLKRILFSDYSLIKMGGEVKQNYREFSIV